MKRKIETEVLDALGTFQQRVASRDVDSVLSLFSTSPEVLLLGSEAGEVASGSEDLREFFERIFARPVSFSWHWSHREATVHGNVAWLYADGVVCISSEDGSRKEQPYRVTGVLIRENEQWKWVQFHGSEPAT